MSFFDMVVLKRKEEEKKRDGQARQEESGGRARHHLNLTWTRLAPNKRELSLVGIVPACLIKRFSLALDLDDHAMEMNVNPSCDGRQGCFHHRVLTVANTKELTV